VFCQYLCRKVTVMNSETHGEKIAIIGGGIAGLYCALVLSQNNRSVQLFETAPRLGGRIRTLRLDKRNRPLHAQDSGSKRPWSIKNLEFYAEFGPMRVELDRQLLLKSLLDFLGIVNQPVYDKKFNAPYLKEFPSYTSPGSPSDPRYELRPDEQGRKPLELLKLAVIRLVLHVEVAKGSTFGTHQQELIRRVSLAAATQQPVDKVFDEWVVDLGEQDYWDIQTTGTIDKVPLYEMGFWNLLSDWLSHDAITMMRDLGNFYHMLPENPNAAEWFVWWLMGFSISQNLHGVYGGMECIVDRLVAQIKKLNTEEILHVDCWVNRIERTSSGKFRLQFDAKSKLPVDSELAVGEYDRVILALPKRPLLDVVLASPGVFNDEPAMNELLDSAFGFPMVKTFFVVKHRWWEEENRANQYATRVPTRELHYWLGGTEKSKQGLIMLYTDAPASSFWSNYVPPGPQVDVNAETLRHLKPALADRLRKKLVRYINENRDAKCSTDDIVWYGIRDWARAPYGGANHAWRPERKYWVVMRRLADIGDNGTARGQSLHVCGEAYSDYHGFIEGALRSSIYVLHRILDRRDDQSFVYMPWLQDAARAGSGTIRNLAVKTKYLEGLREWAQRLDRIAPTEWFKE
jgi:monoamine oxidase